MAWIVLTVIPWGLALVLISVRVRRTPLWWFAVNWFRLVIWGSRMILGIQVRVTGLENLPAGAKSPAILLSKHQSTLETLRAETRRTLALELLYSPWSSNPDGEGAFMQAADSWLKAPGDAGVDRALEIYDQARNQRLLRLVLGLPGGLGLLISPLWLQGSFS